MADGPDFKELLRLFSEKKVEYLIVGGYAVMKYTEPRFTKDLDLWIRNSRENAEKVYQALAEFGAPLQNDGLVPEDFMGDGMTYQIGVAPIRVDVLTHISGIQFPEAWQNRVASTFFGVPTHFIALRDLITNKKAAGRSADLQQLELLEKEAKKETRTD